MTVTMVAERGQGGANCPSASSSRAPHKVTNSILRMGFVKLCKSMLKNSITFELIARNESSEMHFKRMWRLRSQKFRFCPQGLQNVLAALKVTIIMMIIVTRLAAHNFIGIFF